MKPSITTYVWLMTVLLLPGATSAVGQDVVRKTDKTDKTVSVLERIVEVEDVLIDPTRRVRRDSVSVSDSLSRYNGLTDEDFQLVASELGVEIAAIKAVVSIEAGSRMRGFWAPAVPVVNFDSKMYARFKGKAGVPEKALNDTVPGGLTGYALREWTQLVNARKTDCRAANMGSFWGMFQIGGFNYRKCGCETVDEFVELMSYSELEQLELFAAFITNGGMLTDLRNKNWAGFSRKFNGPGYVRRNYHTRMAAAYKKYKAEENKN